MLQAHFADVFRVSIESLRQDTDAVYARLAVFLFGSAATPSFQASLAHFASSQQALARSCHHWSGCHASSTNQRFRARRTHRRDSCKKTPYLDLSCEGCGKRTLPSRVRRKSKVMGGLRGHLAEEVEGCKHPPQLVPRARVGHRRKALRKPPAPRASTIPPVALLPHAARGLDRLLRARQAEEARA